MPRRTRRERPGPQRAALVWLCGFAPTSSWVYAVCLCSVENVLPQRRARGAITLGRQPRFCRAVLTADKLLAIHAWQPNPSAPAPGKRRGFSSRSCLARQRQSCQSRPAACPLGSGSALGALTVGSNAAQGAQEVCNRIPECVGPEPYHFNASSFDGRRRLLAAFAAQGRQQIARSDKVIKVAA